MALKTEPRLTSGEAPFTFKSLMTETASPSGLRLHRAFPWGGSKNWLFRGVADARRIGKGGQPTSVCRRDKISFKVSASTVAAADSACQASESADFN